MGQSLCDAPGCTHHSKVQGLCYRHHDAAVADGIRPPAPPAEPFDAVLKVVEYRLKMAEAHLLVKTAMEVLSQPRGPSGLVDELLGQAVTLLAPPARHRAR